MALTSYTFTVGPALAGNSVSIVQAYVGNSLAFENVAIFSDANGVYPIANPTFLSSSGVVTFYAAAGTYAALPAPKN